MPELPDVNLYVVRLKERLLGEPLSDIKVYSPFALRSVGTPPQKLIAKRITEVFRMGKRIGLAFENDLYLLVHLMIAGRFVWLEGDSKNATRPSKIELARLTWPNGVLTLQEASPKKRAGIWILQGAESLSPHQRTGIDLATSSLTEFEKCLRNENRTLKRALTDPNSFDGIGNAYSDEILFAARLTPVRLTQALTVEEVERLYEACREVLEDWSARLQQLIPKFPKSSEVTAFRKEFNVHGKYGKPCQKCGAPIQRIVGSENEMNYCARCQNDGKVLADRSLSRLLKDDWPKTIEQLMSDS